MLTFGNFFLQVTLHCTGQRWNASRWNAKLLASYHARQRGGAMCYMLTAHSTSTNKKRDDMSLQVQCKDMFNETRRHVLTGSMRHHLALHQLSGNRNDICKIVMTSVKF